MDPATLAIGAAAVSGVSGLSSGLQTASADNTNAGILDRNATLSDQQAQQVYAENVQRETAQRNQAGQQLGAQRAAVAQSGFNPNTGSALDVQVNSAKNAELDALQLRYQGILQGSSLEDQATQQRYQASVQRSNAKSARTGAFISAAGAALAGAAAYGKLAAGGLAAGTTSGVNAYNFALPT